MVRMCTTIGFHYKNGSVFGRTLEFGVTFDNTVIYIPNNTKDYIKTKNEKYDTHYATIGSTFYNIASLGDGINEKGLMGSANLLPNYSSFAEEIQEDKINLTTGAAFSYLLTRCKDVAEVREEAGKMILNKPEGSPLEKTAAEMHFFFMDAKGQKVVLEPKNGKLVAYDNPYGVLTNAPEFPWHETNLKNYLNIKPENVEEGSFNGVKLSKFGEGSGAVGLPGDFTPPSRFIRASFFVSNTPKDLERNAAILQGFRILSQSDIPIGAVIDSQNGSEDEAVYTAVMDTKKKAYYIKYHNNIDIQSFYFEDYADKTEVTCLEVQKEMNL